MSRADSGQLRILRAWLKDTRSGMGWDPATALRMGVFAGEKGIDVDDFGTHSEQWVRLFVEGFAYGWSKRPDAARPDETRTLEESLGPGVVDAGVDTEAHPGDALLGDPAD